MHFPAPIRSRANEESKAEIPWWGVPLILLVLYVCLFSGLDALGFVGPDEPRYAAIARAIFETRDWVTPRLWGMPWFEKPILYYWSGAAAMRLFGVGEFAARLPSALAALLAVLAACWVALRCYGIEAAWTVLLMLPSSVAMIGFARGAGPDMLFAALLTAALALAMEMLQTSRPGPILRILFGFVLGAAVLAKGPAALILAGMAMVLWAAFSRQWRAAFQFLHPWIIAAFCVTALPWYVLCALRNPDFLRVFIWQHNFERYLTPVFEHPQPFWFYGLILIVGTLPWTLALPACFGRPDKQWRDSPGLLIACWCIFPILFFSFSQSKLPGYILPSIPPLFILGAGALARSAQRAAKAGKNLLGATGIGVAAFALVDGSALARTASRYDVPRDGAWTLIVVLGLGGIVAGALGFRNRQRMALLVIAVMTTGLVASANLQIMPSLETRVSARKIAAAYLRRESPEGDVAVYDLNRNWTYGLNYYFGRNLPEWRPGTRLPAWLFTTEQGASKIRQLGLAVQEASVVSAPAAVLLHNLGP